MISKRLPDNVVETLGTIIKLIRDGHEVPEELRSIVMEFYDDPQYLVHYTEVIRANSARL